MITKIVALKISYDSLRRNGEVQNGRRKLCLHGQTVLLVICQYQERHDAHNELRDRLIGLFPSSTRSEQVIGNVRSDDNITKHLGANPQVDRRDDTLYMRFASRKSVISSRLDRRDSDLESLPKWRLLSMRVYYALFAFKLALHHLSGTHSIGATTATNSFDRSPNLYALAAKNIRLSAGYPYCHPCAYRHGRPSDRFEQIDPSGIYPSGMISHRQLSDSHVQSVKIAHSPK